MKKEQSELLDRYLAGEAPQHPERLALPSDSELDEAEALFDQMVAEKQTEAATEKKSRIIHLWPWAVAASLLLLIGIGVTILNDEPIEQDGLIAEKTRTICPLPTDKTETPSDTTHLPLLAKLIPKLLLD